MTANPIDLIGGLATTGNVPKADISSWAKARVRQRMADPTEVRNTKLSGQFAGIYVRGLQIGFDLDTTDTTTPDDGISCIIDFDGNRFKKAGVDTSQTQRKVIVAGNVTVASNDQDIIIVAKTVGAATRVIYPFSASRTKSVRIVDGKYDALTNNITIVPLRPNTVTMSLASPGVISLSAHGLSANSPVSFETTGALYTGLSPDTQYYVKTVVDANNFTVSATPGGAAINTSGSQSGVHTMGTDTIMGSASYVLDSNGASITLTPLSDFTGWV